MSRTARVGGFRATRKGEPAPTQDHVPIEMVKHDAIICKPNRAGMRMVCVVLRVGAADVRRMGPGEQGDFLERYAAAVAAWKFPFQILVWRERQNAKEFVERVKERQRGWNSVGRKDCVEHLSELVGWIEHVTEKVNPQVPIYYIALPHLVSRLGGDGLDKALRELDSRSRLVMHSLGQLNVGSMRLDDDALVGMVHAFYHPSLPVLRLPPKARMRSLMVGTPVTDD
ncbi:MAG: hypothetical protein E3J64_07945 [Anaerolineales bacterium]|nr:MAG: hypothetical protein E3J64_07945 [Anaerolineales bacterium]